MRIIHKVIKFGFKIKQQMQTNQHKPNHKQMVNKNTTFAIDSQPNKNI